jgi:hypothetical protein
VVHTDGLFDAHILVKHEFLAGRFFLFEYKLWTPLGASHCIILGKFTAATWHLNTFTAEGLTDSRRPTVNTIDAKYKLPAGRHQQLQPTRSGSNSRLTELKQIKTAKAKP